MQVEVTKKFSKDVLNLDIDLQEKVISLIATVKEIDTIRNIPNLKKLKGFKNAYRIKIDKYRMGLLMVENNTVSFERCLLRDKIYKVFP